MPAVTPGVALATVLGLVAMGLLVPNAVAAMLAILLRWRSASAASVAPSEPALAGPLPFISVHVPAHDEPPEILIGTLDALAAMTYRDFEVIVLDNNTPDPATWAPVARHCEKLGPRFRFIQRQGIAGAKAGALNIALSLADPRASHVAIVDADYQVTPDFLLRAAQALAHHRADYVQFPQAYRNRPQADAVATELGDYFRAHAPAANATGSMLLTGTLSVIAVDWLRAVGGWPTGTITEDADLGLTLYARGARGVFVNRTVGHGLLPMDFTGLALQRHRWVSGNMQTLGRAILCLPGTGGRSWRRASATVAAHAPMLPTASAHASGRAMVRGGLSVLAQLLAWPGFAAVPAVALMTSAALRLAGISTDLWLLVEAVATATLFATLIALVVEQALIKRQCKTIIVKLALLWTSSTAWLPLLWGRRPVFHRTPKSGASGAIVPAGMAMAGLPILGAAIVLALAGQLPAALALGLLLLGLPAAVAVDRALMHPQSQPPARSEADALSGGDTDLQPC